MARKSIDEAELKAEIETFVKKYTGGPEVLTEDYQEFKKALVPLHFTLYEKACNFSAKIFPVQADKKKEPVLVNDLKTCHINTTPTGVTSFSLLFPLVFMIVGITFSFIISTLMGEGMMFFIMVFVLFGIAMIIPLSTLPTVLANQWRLKASNQMVLSVFYIVSYMRHTSNLELAIKFTSDHLAPPLSIDLKKIIWNVETSIFDSIKESLDDYLNTWKDHNMEFVEAMHLVESSLYEPSEKKRLDSLEKSLTLILEATYEKMLHFAQNLKSPITMLHMLGVILPILGLVILPLMVSFMGGVKWYHIAVFYNLFLPLGVFYLGKVILTTRPSGYGQADITEVNPELKKYTFINIKIAGKKEIKLNPIWVSAAIFVFFMLIAISPIVIQSYHHARGEVWDLVLDDRYSFSVAHTQDELDRAQFSFLGYEQTKQGYLGPFGLGSTLLSITLPLGMAVALSFYYRTRTKKLVQIRDKTKQLEEEFASAIFQLGNRIGDGIPAEIAFGKVASIMDNTLSGTFFQLVTANISNLGMGVETAIFDKKYGAINKYPSALIESSMKVFIESAKKGPEVASESLINISTYVKEMHRVDERLKDLMSEITSSMRSQINFLAPLISGIVIGLTSMITMILNTLQGQLGGMSANAGGQMPAGSLIGMFSVGIPTYYFQFVVGIYVVQITFILTGMLNTIENGYDPLNEKYLLGQFIMKSGMLYCVIAFFVILLFNFIAATVVQGVNIVPAG